MAKTENEILLNYFFEVGVLKNQKHVGWWLAGVKDPESVAEHSFRAAIIAYVLACKEKHSNPEKVACAVLFHDVHETRLGDRHKIASNYAKISKEVEKKVESDQCELLGECGEKVYSLLENGGEIARDADYLEQAITAKEYYDIGYKSAWDWIERIEKVLKTKTARDLCALLKKTDSKTWWQGLKEVVEKLKY
ncbi:MAG: HD domain-containing protein [Candidatus Micrarchaeota archaeon]|nr:HD domain-containing protein [Candidatus Micrarchaeota archaeon]